MGLFSEMMVETFTIVRAFVLFLHKWTNEWKYYVAILVFSVNGIRNFQVSYIVINFIKYKITIRTNFFLNNMKLRIACIFISINY